jgi:hypothetical protein
VKKRGDYRSIFCAFWDDPDIHTLSHEAYRVLTTLKGTLPAAGIGVVYVSQLAERCNMEKAAVERAFGELADWIRRERNIVWIVRGLRYEPSLSSNDRKHQAYLRDRVLAPLGAVPIVDAFKREYAEWFAPEEMPPEEDHGRGNEGPSEQSPFSIHPIPVQSPNDNYSAALPPERDEFWPVIRKHLYVPDGKCPTGWDESRDGSILRQLRQTYKAGDILAAIEGVALLRDYPGKYGDVIDWLTPGSKATLKVLYNTRSGARPMFGQAIDAAHRAHNLSTDRESTGARQPTRIAALVPKAS